MQNCQEKKDQDRGQGKNQMPVWRVPQLLYVMSYTAVMLYPALFILYVLSWAFYRRDLIFAITAPLFFKRHFKYTPLIAEQELQTTQNSRRIKPYTFVPASEQKSLQKESGDNNASNIKKQTEAIVSGGSLSFLRLRSCEDLLRITSKNRGTQERYSAFERKRETCAPVCTRAIRATVVSRLAREQARSETLRFALPVPRGS